MNDVRISVIANVRGIVIPHSEICAELAVEELWLS